MNVMRATIVVLLLLLFIHFKVDKDTFNNLEWIASGCLVLLSFITFLVASIADDLNKS